VYAAWGYWGAKVETLGLITRIDGREVFFSMSTEFEKLSQLRAGYNRAIYSFLKRSFSTTQNSVGPNATD